MRWSELPVEARRYIIYHALVSPVLITWYMLPFYLMKTGYSVLEVGAIFTAAHLLGIPVTLLLGKRFTRADMRLGLAAIDVMGASSLVFFSLAYGPLAPLMIVLGQLIDKASGVLYFLYPAYERIVYPEGRFKEAMVWHLALPELSVVLTYPVVGYILGYICDAPPCFRAAFLVFAIYELLLVPYILIAFKPVVLEAEEEAEEEAGSAWRRYKLYVAADALFITAWSLAPSLALVYLVMERFGGNMFHVALAEASTSLASLSSLPLADRIPSDRAFQSLQAATLLTVAGLAAIVLSSSFPVLLASVYMISFGNALIFVFKRTWLFSIMGRREASTVSAALSSLRRALGVASPLLAGALATLDPRVPYIACLALLAVTIPLYSVAGRRSLTIG